MIYQILTPHEWRALREEVQRRRCCACCGLEVELRTVAGAFGPMDVWVCPNGHEFPTVKP